MTPTRLGSGGGHSRQPNHLLGVVGLTMHPHLEVDVFSAGWGWDEEARREARRWLVGCRDAGGGKAARGPPKRTAYIVALCSPHLVVRLRLARQLAGIGRASLAARDPTLP